MTTIESPHCPCLSEVNGMRSALVVSVGRVSVAAPTRLVQSVAKAGALRLVLLVLVLTLSGTLSGASLSAQASTAAQSLGRLRGSEVPFSHVVHQFFLNFQAWLDDGRWGVEDMDAAARRFSIQPGSLSLERAAYVLRDVEMRLPVETPQERAVVAKGGLAAKAVVRARTDMRQQILGREYAQLLLDLESEGALSSYKEFEARLIEHVRSSMTVMWVDEEDPMGRLAEREAAFAKGVRELIPDWEPPR